MGIFYANTLHNHIPNQWQGEIAFSAKKILRFAIVFYGFRITFQEIINVGIEELRDLITISDCGKNYHNERNILFLFYHYLSFLVS
ncbi:MAG: hypothetical protein KU28_08060 [Sulfurovum sp. PC08-66]|nr:MAG: hypothetical protein KU28_08060 [Sulfurovum sp. PC08-66]